MNKNEHIISIDYQHQELTAEELKLVHALIKQTIQIEPQQTKESLRKIVEKKKGKI